MQERTEEKNINKWGKKTQILAIVYVEKQRTAHSRRITQNEIINPKQASQTVK